MFPRKLILPHKQIKILNNNILLHIIMYKVELKLSNLTAQFIHFLYPWILNIVNINMVTEEVNVVEELFFSLLERSVHQQWD